MERLPLPVQTLFIEFTQTVASRSALENKWSDTGIYVRKRVKGHQYWYLQHHVKGQSAQAYVGPCDEINNSRIEAKKSERKLDLANAKKLKTSEIKMAAMLKRAGIPSLNADTANLLSVVARSFMSQGALLVGSHAFAAYCGMLGTLFDHALLKTLDVDIAIDRTVTFSGPSINVLEQLQQADSGFREIPSLSRRYPAHSFIAPTGLRVDFIAPLLGPSKGMIPIKGAPGVSAEPLRFLDFLMKDPVDGVLIGPKGGIIVRIPDPVRFAIHKLIISSYRPVTESAKRQKDLAQAAQLIGVCQKERMADYQIVMKEAIRRGPKWKKAIELALKK